MADEFIGLGETPIEQPVVNDGSATVNVAESSVEPVAEPIQKTPTDPNKITVHVIDHTAPILLIFGAPSSGKTMTLVRLAKYLRTQGYSLSVDTNFCTNAWEYTENAGRFNNMLGTTSALSGTGRNDFLFLKICDGKGKTVCQILEGAGEDYFPTVASPGQTIPHTPFPAYMNGIFTATNKKIWMFITEPDWKVDFNRKNDYVERIRYCKNQYFAANRDKSIILYNKVDTTKFVYGPGQVEKKNAMNACNNEYPGLFEIFKNQSALSFFQDKYTCKFVPFSTGVYGQSIPGQQANYVQSHDSYPHVLWEAIMKCIKG